jgi:hypothetical protein
VFSFDSYFQGMVLHWFENTGTQVVELSCAKDPDPQREQGAAIVRAFAPLTRLITSARKRQRTKAGRKPYGARSNEEQVIHIIRGLQKAGHSFKDIADELNQMRIEPRTRGARWHAFTISRIIGRSSGAALHGPLP